MWFQRRTKTYRVSADRDDWVAPEETLVDSTSGLSTVEVPVSDSIFRGAYILSAVLLFGLILAVGRLSVMRYADLGQIAQRNRTVNVAVPPPRGLIMDRNGTLLVQNVPSFDILAIGRQIRRNADGTFTDIDALSQILGYNREELTLALTDAVHKNAVFFAATDVSRDRVLTIRNALPAGFYLITSTKRQYTDSEAFAHLIGYVGKVSRADMTADSYYLPSDTIGRLGLESQYESVLRGAHGQLLFQATKDTVSQAPTTGNNVVLALDAQVQKALYASLWSILRQAGLDQGAAVAQDPRTGAILGMVSFPTYDNNVFTGQLSQADANKLFNSKQRPLFNRAISGLYNPGSTIKPYIGMTALAEKIMTPGQIVNRDCVNLTVPNPTDTEHPYIFKNWRADVGPFDLYRAIADSCNVYFFTVGGGFGNIAGLGADRIVSYLHKGFADVTLGIDLPGEEHGFIPTPDWKYETKKEPWYQGDTYNISIGQGDLLVTPLWINSYVSAIANGGALWQPMMAARIVDEQKNTLAVASPHQIGTLPFSEEVIDTMRAAMRRTVTDGTAKIFKDLPVTSAAKTGTAEVIKGQRINSLLTVYAPAQDPQIALTVLIEGSASNQGYALRAAHDFLRWYFAPNHVVPTPTPSPTPSPSPSRESSPSPTPSP